MLEKNRKIADYLTREEIKNLILVKDRHGWSALFSTWFLIGLALALIAWRVNFWTVPLALVLLGGRQLALAILMHEAAHRTLFRSKALNDWVGKWLCAAPTWNHLKKYRTHHLVHHNHTGTERDTDLGLVTPFPATRGSLARKFLRDLSGISGLRRIGALLLIDFGFLGYTASVGAKPIPREKRTARAILHGGLVNFGPVLLTNACLFAILFGLGHPWLYLLWVIAYLTTYSLFLRIRAIAEHACTDRTADQFRNTRTTYAGWLARLTVAPHRVNYHLEHHLLMTVPHFRLPQMHELLVARGALSASHVAPNYVSVLSIAGNQQRG